MGLGILKNASRALERLQVSLDAKIYMMERTVRPAALHHGIHALPDETLFHIMKVFLGDPEVDLDHNGFEFKDLIQRHRDVRRLSFVCRRFRTAVRLLPSLLANECVISGYRLLRRLSVSAYPLSL